MRWERLFDDLEGQMELELRRELECEIADRTRAERATVDLVGRLMGARAAAAPLSVRTADGALHSGAVRDVGDGWLLLAAPHGAQLLLPLAACTAFAGLPRPVGTAGQVARRMGLGGALRALSRNRAVVDIADRSGQVSTGTIGMVGADHAELAEHAADAHRRRDAVTAVRVVPFSAVVSVSNHVRVSAHS